MYTIDLYSLWYFNSYLNTQLFFKLIFPFVFFHFLPLPLFFFGFCFLLKTSLAVHWKPIFNLSFVAREWDEHLGICKVSTRGWLGKENQQKWKYWFLRVKMLHNPSVMLGLVAVNLHWKLLRASFVLLVHPANICNSHIGLL